METKNQQNNFSNPVVVILALALVGLGGYMFFSKNLNNDSEKKITETRVIKTQTASVSVELSQNPEYLFSKTFNPNLVKVYGVGIGDLESNINQSSIIKQQEYFGWVRTTNGIAYRIANGKVVEIALNEMVKSLGIYSESNIIMRFGQPDKIDTTSDYYVGSAHNISKNYYYISRGLLVIYHEGTVSSVGINITGVY